MKIRELLKLATDRLKAKGIATSALDAEILLAHALGIERLKLFTTTPMMTQDVSAKFDELLKRREQFAPIAQILGTKEFWGLDFKVTHDVLIPRPETELIIELSTEYFPNNADNISILDLGTGSGCIVISLLTEYKHATATAVDISPEALKLARENAERHDTDSRLELFQGNWFAALPARTFDLIVANPPYIGYEEALAPEVFDYDPHMALFAGNNGLAAYSQIAASLGNFMHKNSYAIFEMGANQADDVANILRAHNIRVIKTAKDLAGHTRALVCIKV